MIYRRSIMALLGFILLSSSLFSQDNPFAKGIDSVVSIGLKANAFPGCQVLVLRNGAKVFEKCYGYTTYGNDQAVTPEMMYDLASLSKTTGVLMGVMKLYDQGKIKLDDRASDYLRFLKGSDKEDITIRQLLFHESGLPPTIFFYRLAMDSTSFTAPFYVSQPDENHATRIDEKTWACSSFKLKPEYVSATCSAQYPLQIAQNMFLSTKFHDRAMKLIASAPLKAKEYRYSCVNFILLKEIVETITSTSLDVYLDKNYYLPMGLHHIGYLPLRKHKLTEIVPTVENDFLRHGQLRGFVHDESAAFFGGISGNAGLFANAGDVATIYQMLLNNGILNGKRYLKESTCKLFSTTTSASGRRGLGFDKPVPGNPDRSPCGKLAPYAVYGHTGFTGTCCWVDPINRLVYVFLSNRTYPNVWNNKLSQLNIRTEIQDVIYKAIK